MSLKIEELSDYVLENVFASNGKVRLWCRFSPFYNTATYRLEDLKAKATLVRFADLQKAIDAFNGK